MQFVHDFAKRPVRVVLRLHDLSPVSGNKAVVSRHRPNGDANGAEGGDDDKDDKDDEDGADDDADGDDDHDGDGAGGKYQCGCRDRVGSWSRLLGCGVFVR